MSLRNQVAIITGSSSGIGRGVALAFAREGAAVVVNYPDEPQAQAARSVRINSVAPGATKTPILADVPSAVLEQIRLAIPIGRIAEVDDIVPTHVFLASQDARHFQGQTLSPNGGDQFL